jgi:hypothetical protein
LDELLESICIKILRNKNRDKRWDRKPGTMAHICNPSYTRGRDGEEYGLRQLEAKSWRDPTSTNKKLVVVVHTGHSSYTGRINM